MASGDEIVVYKNRIIRDILHNEENPLLSQDIVMAIDEDFVGCEDELLYRNIYPYTRIPTTEDEVKVYITMKVDMPRVSTKNYFFKDMLIYINVIVHQEAMKMPDEYSATRADYIGSLINKIFNQNPNYGNKPLEYVSDVESILLDKYFVRTIRFSCDELNAVRC